MTAQMNSSATNKSSSSVSAKEVLATDTLSARPIPAEGQLKVIDDPFANYIMDNWRSIIVSMLAAGAIFYGVSVYRSTALKARQNSGDSFIGLQHTFGELQQQKVQNDLTTAQDAASIEKASTEKIEIEKRFDSQLKSLSFAKSPYPDLGSFYKTLNQLSAADGKAVRQQVITQASFKTQKEGTLDRLTNELLFLAAARAEIDSDITAARAALTTLVDDGQFASAAAAKSLASIADTDETRGAAKIAIENALAHQPELSEELSQAMH